jgi:flagella basal body P-ring formation protein FlgA
MNSPRLISIPFLLPWLFMSALTFAQDSRAPLYQAVESYLRTQTQGLPGKASFRVTPLDTRTQLSVCDAYEAFSPSGGAPLGKTTIGVRCLGPSSWTVYLQAQVSVQSQYLIATRSLTAGQVIATGDFRSKSGDLGLLPPTVLIEAGQAVGKTLKVGIAAGQALRSDQLLAVWTVQFGQSVKTITRGEGFSVSSDGKAMNNAMEGQVVQVRIASGQIISGVARPGGIVEVSY